ncbi:MAG: copper resistance protein CopB [Betaproteobacteria bacterium HGW-Betaproteobacteria-11]|nr:MAG: copper resistance protein CopB [Betaproteobacteria bacterium HGW-Betaproteobacteria-11]
MRRARWFTMVAVLWGVTAWAQTPSAEARDPHAEAAGYGFSGGAHPHAGHPAYSVLRVDRFEHAFMPGDDATLYDLHGRYGGSFDRAVLKAEGEIARGKVRAARTELLWSHAVSPFWDTQLGVRHDGGVGPDRGWLALGVEGLAPYWFDVEVTAYLGPAGRTALRLAASYELLLTQRLILQPRVEADFHGKRDSALDHGSGLTDAVAGLRLRYEFNRQFAPYLGVERGGKVGNSADLAQAAGERAMTTRWVAGLKFWF